MNCCTESGIRGREPGAHAVLKVVAIGLLTG